MEQIEAQLPGTDRPKVEAGVLVVLYSDHALSQLAKNETNNATNIEVTHQD